MASSGIIPGENVLGILEGGGNSAGAALGGIQNKTRIEQNKEGKGGGGGIKIKAEIPPKNRLFGKSGRASRRALGPGITGPRADPAPPPLFPFSPFSGGISGFLPRPPRAAPDFIPGFDFPPPERGINKNSWAWECGEGREGGKKKKREKKQKAKKKKSRFRRGFVGAEAPPES